MRKISFRISETTLVELNSLKDVYNKKSVSDLLDLILDFLTTHQVDLSKDFDLASVQNLYFQNLNLMKSIGELNNNLGSIYNQNDKNTTRIIKILQAQERDILLPILRNDIKVESDKIIREEIENNSDIQALSSIPKDEDLLKLEEENRLLKNKVAYLEKEKNSLMSDNFSTMDYENKLKNIATLFTKSRLSGNYSASISDSEFRKIFGLYV